MKEQGKSSQISQATLTPPNFNSSPLKMVTFPKGMARFPTIIFQWVFSLAGETSGEFIFQLLVANIFWFWAPKLRGVLMIQFGLFSILFQSGVGGKKTHHLDVLTGDVTCYASWKHICEAPGVDQRPSTSTAKRGCWRHQVCPCHEWMECCYFYLEKSMDLSSWKGRDQGTSDYTL